MADGLFDELGLRIPKIQLFAAEYLTGHQVRIIVGDAAPALRIGLAPDHLLCAEPAEDLAKRGITAVATTPNPANGRMCAIIAARDSEAVGSYTWDPVSYLILATAAELRRQSHLLVDVNSVERELAVLHELYPTLVLAALDRFTVGYLTRVVRILLTDRMSIRNLKAILESLLVTDLFDAVHRRDRLSDADHGALEARIAMSRHVVQRTGTLRAYLLDSLLEREIKALIDGENGAVDIRESDLEARRERIRAVVSGALEPARDEPPVILISGAIRVRLRRLMLDQRPDLVVLAFEELPRDMQIQPLVTISLTKEPESLDSGMAPNGREINAQLVYTQRVYKYFRLDDLRRLLSHIFYVGKAP